MKTFVEFVNKKEREAKRHLKIIKKLLESQGMKVTDHLDDSDEPYIFMFNPQQNVTFDGIRIYQIGTQIAFRIQKEETTQPFGKAYPLDIEEMFNDLMSDHHKPEDAGKKVVEAVANEIKKFFIQSADAERDLRNGEFDPMGKIVIRGGQSDYSNMVYTKG
jgi:lipoate-protein ligase A